MDRPAVHRGERLGRVDDGRDPDRVGDVDVPDGDVRGRLVSGRPLEPEAHRSGDEQHDRYERDEPVPAHSPEHMRPRRAVVALSVAGRAELAWWGRHWASV